MKSIIAVFLLLALCMSAVTFTGCDDRRNIVTRACWVTIDDSKTFYPMKKVHWAPLKKLSKDDIAFIKTALEAAETRSHIEDGERIICRTSSWSLTDFTPVSHKTPRPAQCEFVGVMVDIRYPVTIELHTKHCPKGPKKSWHWYTDDEIQALKDDPYFNYDYDNHDHRGYWVYDEVECD